MSKTYFLMLIILALLTGLQGSAQERNIRFGLLVSGGIKYPFISGGDRNYHLFGDAGFGAMARISGHDERAISFQPKLVFARENIGYHHTSVAKYYIESVNVVFNPEIIFPTRHEHWQIAGGIGIDWVIDNDVAVYLNNRSTAGANLSEAYDIIRATRRPLIPFVSAGVLRRIKAGLHLQLGLRQDLRNAFPDDTVVTFYGGPDTLTVQLSHMPTRLVLGVLYLF